MVRSYHMDGVFFCKASSFHKRQRRGGRELSSSFPDRGTCKKEHMLGWPIRSRRIGRWLVGHRCENGALIHNRVFCGMRLRMVLTTRRLSRDKVDTVVNPGQGML